MSTPKPSMGSTAIAVWRAWRSLPWQGYSTYGNALGVGEFCWQPDRSKPSGHALHRVLDAIASRPATVTEEDEVWECLLSGALRIYTRRNGVGVSTAPLHILHKMTGSQIPAGLELA